MQVEILHLEGMRAKIKLSIKGSTFTFPVKLRLAVDDFHTGIQEILVSTHPLDDSFPDEADLRLEINKLLKEYK